jgi:very-short-patch-repair endonuclease
MAKKYTKEWKDNISKANKGKCYSPKTCFKKGYKPWNTGKGGYKFPKDKYPNFGLRGKKLSEGTKKKISKSLLGNTNTLGFKISKATRKKISKNSKLNWQNKEYREKTIRNQLKGLFKRPTSLEMQMIQIIKKHNLPYRYVGNGSFLIGFKNPDFVNVNGQKICIEVANTFHHNNDYAKNRMEYFKKWGWKCIVFRTNKLEEQNIKTILEII